MVRFKNRYLLCEIVHDEEECITQFQMGYGQLKNLILHHVELNFGELGVARVKGSLSIKYFNQTTRCMILRVARDYKNIIWNSLAFLPAINGKSAKIRVLHSSGTIKKCEIKAQRYLTLWLHQLLKNPAILESYKDQITKNYSQIKKEL